jgi:hypothetical protein
MQHHACDVSCVSVPSAAAPARVLRAAPAQALGPRGALAQEYWLRVRFPAIKKSDRLPRRRDVRRREAFAEARV